MCELYILRFTALITVITSLRLLFSVALFPLAILLLETNTSVNVNCITIYAWVYRKYSSPEGRISCFLFVEGNMKSSSSLPIMKNESVYTRAENRSLPTATALSLSSDRNSLANSSAFVAMSFDSFKKSDARELREFCDCHLRIAKSTKLIVKIRRKRGV